MHNHWWEFQPVQGIYPYESWLEHLESAVFLSSTPIGSRPPVSIAADIVRRFGARAPLLHIKDGPATIEAPMVAVGSGELDFPAIVEAANGHAEWLIVELDRCATGMMAAVGESYRYLTGAGLAHGSR